MRERTFIVEGLRAWLLLSGLALALLTCNSADKNLTAKDIDCSVLTYSNSMTCCLQFMSSKTGSDSKDAICGELVSELRDHLREERKKNLLLFCSGQLEENDSFKSCLKRNERFQCFQSCWDTINSK